MTFRTVFLPICLVAALAGLWFIQREGIASGNSPFVAEGQAKTKTEMETAPAPGTVDLTPEAFRQEFMESVQRLRAGPQFSVLKPDARIEQWLSAQGDRLTLDHLEASLASAMLPDFRSLRAAGAAGSALRVLLPGLLQRLEAPETAKDDSIAFLFRPGPDHGQEVIVITAESMPDLNLTSLDQGSVASFTSQCPHCGKRSAFHHEKSRSTLVLECPHCGLTMRLLGRDTKGNYHDATAFLIPSSFPTVAAGTHPLDAMISIWQAAVRRCQYVGDGNNDDEPTDFWQTPRQTLVKGTGDCEDSALLLTDWMLSNKIPARMALGTVDGSGHAWCIVRMEETDYLLESTNRNPDLENLPAVNRNDGYGPTALFDREALYVRAHPKAPFDGDYWSPEKWLKIPRTKSAPAPPKVAPKP